MKITLKEYAKENSVTYESVRKKFNKYKKDLKGHYSKIERTTYLDEYAYNFLKEHSVRTTILIEKIHDKDQIEQLKNMVQYLKGQIDVLDNQNRELTENYLKVKENIQLLEYTQKENDSLKEELRKYKKTIFGLYKKMGD